VLPARRGRFPAKLRQFGRLLTIEMEDDGPGLFKAAMGKALVPGRRLDEGKKSHGFGLPIAHKLAELHGDRLDLAVSSLGGLKATLPLPAARPVQSGIAVSEYTRIPE